MLELHRSDDPAEPVRVVDRLLERSAAFREERPQQVDITVVLASYGMR